jgi:hypothetical protein
MREHDLGHRRRIDPGVTKPPLQDRPVGIGAGIEDDQFAAGANDGDGGSTDQELVGFGGKAGEQELDVGHG